MVGAPERGALPFPLPQPPAAKTTPNATRDTAIHPALSTFLFNFFIFAPQIYNNRIERDSKLFTGLLAIC